MKDPINIAVTNYPTLSVYLDLAQTDAAEEFKIRWSSQKSAKNEVLVGLFVFPTRTLVLTQRSPGVDDYIPRAVFEKLEELYQKYLADPRTGDGIIYHSVCEDERVSFWHPDFDLALSA